jgi:hypothetical protein
VPGSNSAERLATDDTLNRRDLLKLAATVGMSDMFTILNVRGA